MGWRPTSGCAGLRKAVAEVSGMKQQSPADTVVVAPFGVNPWQATYAGGMYLSLCSIGAWSERSDMRNEESVKQSFDVM